MKTLHSLVASSPLSPSQFLAQVLCTLTVWSLAMSPSVAHARNSFDFDQLWSRLQRESYPIQAQRAESQAAEIHQHRAAKHWAPRLMLGAQLVSTNDAATTLFSQLKSRTLLASDLNPSLMNDPGRQWFKQGGITLDWAFFEGGMKVALHQGARFETQAKNFQTQAQIQQEYARLAHDYAKLTSLRAETSGYQALKEKLLRILGTYRLGSKENPVGYSGLLGMKALLNRLNGQIDQTLAEAASIEKSLLTQAKLADATISTPAQKAPELIAAKLGDQPRVSEKAHSLQTQAIAAGADAAEAYSKAETARWLPRAGVFASGNLTSSARASGTSTEVGAYLQWELFNATNLGATQEARLKAQAARANADAQQQGSRIAQDSLETTIPALKENLSRAEDSLQLTEEQVEVTERLFKNGSINALQWVEVLSRRADVIHARAEIETAYLQALTQNFLQSSDLKKVSLQ